MSKILVAVLAVMTCVSLAPAADIEFDVTAVFGWDTYYRPMEWTPVDIRLSSDATEPFSGSFTISSRQDGLNRLNVTAPFVLTPDLTHSIPLVTKIGFGMGQCDLAVRDERGGVRWDMSVEMWDDSGLKRQLYPIEDADVLVGLIGRLEFGVLHLPERARSVSERGSGHVFVGSRAAADSPRDWTGFTGLDVLVLYDPDWSLMHRESLTAVAQYVRNGGTLLLILGQHPLSRTNPITELIPVTAGEPRQVQIDSDLMKAWGLPAHRVDPVTAWPLAAKAGAPLIDTLVTPSGQCVFAQGRVGFGQVAVLGFNPSQFDSIEPDQRTPFWVSQIKTCLEDPPQETPGPAAAMTGPEMLRQLYRDGPGQVRGRKGRTIVLTSAVQVDRDDPSDLYQISAAQNAGNRVMTFLYQLSQMKPLSIWWVVLILATLALLLGPVDYFVLKRLDRLPLTWLTSLGWIVLFTVGAYYGVQYLRGGRMQVRAVSVIDGIAGTDCTWATHYAGIFAPSSGDYRLEGLDTNQWWSGIAPTAEMLRGRQQTTGSRQIYCVQTDGANLPASVPIGIWTVQTLMAETPAPALPFTATVQLDGDIVTTEVTNLSGSRIARGFVMFDNAWVVLDSVEPGGSRSFRKPRQRFVSRDIGADQRGSGLMTPQYPPGLPMTAAFLAPGSMDRSVAMQSYVRAGAALVCVEFDEAPIPFSVAKRSYDTVHVQMARQVVFPR